MKDNTSTRIPTYLIERAAAKCSASAFVTYTALWYFHDNFLGDVSQEEIGKFWGKSRGTINRHLKELADAGLVMQIHRPGRTSEYIMVHDAKPSEGANHV